MARNIALLVAGSAGALALTVGLAAAGFVPRALEPTTAPTAQAAEMSALEEVIEEGSSISAGAARIVVVAPDGSSFTIEIPDGDPATVETLIGMVTQGAAPPAASALEEQPLADVDAAEPTYEEAKQVYEEERDEYEERDDDDREEEEEDDDDEDDD